ncbi:MAG: Serine hydrolase, partial [Mycobacterium sp.]|nr:Serine hydrolase [Mycobacterium sp.]
MSPVPGAGGRNGGLADLDERGHHGIHHRAARRARHSAGATGGDDEHRAWTDNGPEFSYGLGLGGITLPCGATVWCHGGDIGGYNSIVAKDTQGHA